MFSYTVEFTFSFPTGKKTTREFHFVTDNPIRNPENNTQLRKLCIAYAQMDEPKCFDPETLQVVALRHNK